MARLLVTGNLGYIGTELVTLAKRKGHDITGLDSGFFADCLLTSPTADPDRQILCDIRDIASDCFEGLDGVIHLAALSNDPISELDPDLTYEINHKAAVDVAARAKAAGVPRFVFASSASVYGIASETVSELSKTNPLTAYAKSKFLAERDLFALADSNFAVTALRPATAYGLGARLRTDIVLNNLCAWAHCEGKISIMSDGTPLRPAAHVKDIASAFLGATLCPSARVQRQIFNVGRNSDNYSVRQMAEAVQACVPECALVFTGEHSDSRSYAINFDKIAAVLGDIAPLTISLAQGVEELISGYRRHRLSAAEFRDGRYTRLARIKHHRDLGNLDSTLRWKAPPAELKSAV